MPDPAARGHAGDRPPGAFGLGADSLAAGFDSAERLRWLAGNPDAAARLRTGWNGLGLAGVPGRLTDRDMVSLLGSAVASHRLALAYFPRPIDPLDRINADRLPRAALPVAPVTARAVRDMSHTERVEAALKRVPGHLTGALKEAFLGLISPTSLVITVTTFAGLAVAQLAGYGEVADAVLAAIAYEIAGLSGVRALYDMVAATVNAAMATSDADIDAAAARLAGAFVTLGMAFLTIFLTRAARKAAQSRSAGGGGESPAASTRPSAREAKTPPRAPRTAETTRISSAADDGILLPKKINTVEPGAVDATPELEAQMDAAAERGAMQQEGYPDLPADAAKTFGETPRPWNGDEASGPISRVVDAQSNPNGSFWAETAPSGAESDWRSGSAVQNNWNGDGGYVQSSPVGVRGWIGKAAPQLSSDGTHILPGGADQIWIPPNTAAPSNVMPTPWNTGNP